MHNGTLRSLGCSATILRGLDSELSDDTEVTEGGGRVSESNIRPEAT